MGALADALLGPAEEVAPRLLGALLTHAGVTVRLTEVEAYAGLTDPGSHAFRGRTSRNAVMFGPPAHLYVYFTYGMHYCANVVCGPEGTPSGILMRAGEVVAGAELASERRGGVTGRDLARGPARLCKALALTIEQGGAPLDRASAAGPVLTLSAPAERWQTGPRVGLRAAADRPWRYWLPDEPSVSTYRPAAPLRRRSQA